MKIKTKNVLKMIALSSFLVLVALIAFLLSGCREASKVNYNMSREADYFNVERRITVYNARTDKIVMEIEGYMSISNSHSDELTITVKTGEQEYRKNYVYLNSYTLYVVEDITGTHADPYHYCMSFHVLPQIAVDIKP